MEPLAAESRAALRRAVFGLRQGERRRVFPPQVHVGDPDGAFAAYADRGEPLDPTLRTDIVAALLRLHPEGQPAALWLTRVGQPTTHDVDLAWMPAAVAAFAEAGVEARWVSVVTKQGWYSPFGDDRVTWQRLRFR